jgi:hypothetical protein
VSACGPSVTSCDPGRSAAGLYCWDCRTTLCKDGERGIHTGWSSFYDACPKCEKTRDESEDHRTQGNAAGVELGFAKPREDKPGGVRSCSSFRWASPPEEVRARCEANMDAVIVVNEYGDEYTGAAFLRMLAANCPVQFTDWIGHGFS